MDDTGIIILAAGSSSRLGKPKQLLSFQHKLLIEHVTDEAIKAKLHPLIVVTGAFADQVASTLDHKAVTIAYNKDWQEGMGSGIAAGVFQALLINKTLQNLIISVCDQPFVSADLFLQLIKMKNETGKKILACAYNKVTGTPVLFDRAYFPHLQELTGTEGARGLVKKHGNDVAVVAFPLGSIDIDTEADYQSLLSKEIDGVNKKQ